MLQAQTDFSLSLFILSRPPIQVTPCFTACLTLKVALTPANRQTSVVASSFVTYRTNALRWSMSLFKCFSRRLSYCLLALRIPGRGPLPPLKSNSMGTSATVTKKVSTMYEEAVTLTNCTGRTGTVRNDSRVVKAASVSNNIG